MEPLWSPAVATTGKQSRLQWPKNPPETAQLLANGCDRSPEPLHGKTQVDRASGAALRRPLLRREGVDLFLERAKSREPEGQRDLTRQL